MPKKHLLYEIGISRRNFAAIFILVFNAFTWYFVMSARMRGILNSSNITYIENLSIWVLYYTTIICSGIVGSVLARKIGRSTFLCLWMALGTVFSLLPVASESHISLYSLGVFTLWAISFGIGMPSCLAYFADFTLIENRGHTSGITSLAILLGVFPLVIVQGMLDPTSNALTSAAWRGFGLLAFFLLKPRETVTDTKKNSTYLSILRDRSFLLYLIPWIMFCLVNRLEAPILDKFGFDFIRFLVMVEFVVGSFSALIAGVISDLIGRKRVIIVGFIALGIGYAALGVAPGTIVTWYFYCMADGIAWGIFVAMFILILWGDLSQNGVREKYYLLGITPYLLSDVVQLLLTPYVKEVQYYTAFSLASFFLFLAVLPLMYAPETLPEKKIELRRLRGYIEQAKKVREKQLGKSETEG